MNYDEVYKLRYALLSKWALIAGKAQYATKEALKDVPRTDWNKLRNGTA